MRRTILCLGVVAMSVLAVGCGDDDDGTSSTGTTVTTSSLPGTTTSGAAASTSTISEVEVLVVLNPDGLGFTTAESGSISRIDFGSDRQLTRDAVEKSLGEPVEEGLQEECAPAPTGYARWPEISLYFDEGETFVGWSISRDSPLTTGDGIGVGSTLAEFEGAYGDVTVEDTSLGREFFDGPYIGSVDEADVIDRLDAGTICAFR